MPAKKRNTRRKTTARRRTTRTATPTKRRRRTVKKKTGLSAAFTSPKAKASIKGMSSGALGGGLYYLYQEKVSLPNETPEKRGLLALAGAYLLSAAMDKPDMAAGAVGAAAFDFMTEKGFLSENMDLAAQEMEYIKQLPETLDANNMDLAENMELAADYNTSYFQGY